jgi:hypothetical protein
MIDKLLKKIACLFGFHSPSALPPFELLGESERFTLDQKNPDRVGGIAYWRICDWCNDSIVFYIVKKSKCTACDCGHEKENPGSNDSGVSKQ